MIILLFSVIEVYEMRNSISYILFVATIVSFQQLPRSCITDVTGNFIEIPSSVTVGIENGVEMDALFRCRHQRIDALISWLMNGSSSRLNHDVVDGFILDSNGTRVDTLTIPAIPEYNGIEIVCGATFIDRSPSEVTPPANLIIIIMVTHEAITQPLPPTAFTVVSGFVMTPSSLNKTVEQGEAVFHCRYRSSHDITWRVNGTSVSSHDNISEWRVLVGDGYFVDFLSIPTLPGFNNTTIECGAIFFDKFRLLFTPPVTLLVQGIPGNVSNLVCERNYSSGTLTTFWYPLPTLDITDRDPDIIYHVQIFKTTCGQSVFMSDENVTESITSNSLSPLELMGIYSAVITPRNNVPRYVNGPRRDIKEKFMSLSGMTLFELSRRPPTIITSVEPVPRYYTMMLESLDGIGSNMRVNISVQRDGEMVTMQTGEPLPPRQLWTALILPYNCVVDMQISITGNFIDGSTATGVFLIVYSLTNESDIIFYHTINKENEQNNNININVTGLIGTEYGISVFALENGLPFPRVVTSPRTVILAASNDQERAQQPPLSPIEYEVHSSGSGPPVCITCTFKDNTVRNCVAVVHQRISQLNSSRLMNIESSHKFTRSGDTAYGCIEGVNLEQYQVGVIGGRRSVAMTHHTSSSPRSLYYIIGIVCAAVLVAVVLVGTTLSVLLYCIKRFHSSKFRHSSINPDHVSISPDEGGRPSLGESEVDVEMKRCAAYQVVQLSR